MSVSIAAPEGDGAVWFFPHVHCSPVEPVKRSAVLLVLPCVHKDELIAAPPGPGDMYFHMARGTVTPKRKPVPLLRVDTDAMPPLFESDAQALTRAVGEPFEKDVDAIAGGNRHAVRQPE